MSQTTHPNIINELCRYFMQFPNRDNILKRFRKRPTDAYSSTYYTELKTYLEELEDGYHSLCQGIDDFVFYAQDMDYIKKQIEDMDGSVYLMLDYGNITCNEQGKQKTHLDSFELAITVAKTFKISDLDSFEMAALSDEMLNNIRSIREKLMADNACCTGTKDDITFPHNIIPFYARDLQNSIGWTLTFSQLWVDLM